MDAHTVKISHFNFAIHGKQNMDEHGLAVDPTDLSCDRGYISHDELTPGLNASEDFDDAPSQSDKPSDDEIRGASAFLPSSPFPG